MCFFELTATPATSPRCMSGGNLSTFGTESYGISGTDCCANAGGQSSTTSPMSPGFMGSLPCCTDECFPAVDPSVQAGGAARQSAHRGRPPGASIDKKQETDICDMSMHSIISFPSAFTS